MSQIKDGVLYIQDQSPKMCSVCGRLTETRPYGKGGALVCFPCGMKDEETVNREYQKRLDQANRVVVVKGGNN